jgi:hypothetical protein
MNTIPTPAATPEEITPPLLKALSPSPLVLTVKISPRLRIKCPMPEIEQALAKTIKRLEVLPW